VHVDPEQLRSAQTPGTIGQIVDVFYGVAVEENRFAHHGL
jgi:hypothetical protein